MKEVVDIMPEGPVALDAVCDAKIYAFSTKGRIFKAQRVGDNGWSFVSMNGSLCWWNGSHSSLRALIKTQLKNNVYEFSCQKEFFKWAIGK